MADITSEQWTAQQMKVWGDKDPETFRRVVERVMLQEKEVVAEVERMARAGISGNAITHYVTNAILRGVDDVVYEPAEGITLSDCDGNGWDRVAKRWAPSNTAQ